MSHTRRSDASEKSEENIQLLDVFACGQVWNPRLYRLRRLSLIQSHWSFILLLPTEKSKRKSKIYETCHMQDLSL